MVLRIRVVILSIKKKKKKKWGPPKRVRSVMSAVVAPPRKLLEQGVPTFEFLIESERSNQSFAVNKSYSIFVLFDLGERLRSRGDLGDCDGLAAVSMELNCSER